MSLKSIRCALFDLDGTLVDTAPDLGGAANAVRASLGLPPLPLANYRPVASSGARGLLGMALDITPEHADFPARRDLFLKTYGENIAQASQPFPGMTRTLATLALRGVRWGVATNKPRRYTVALLEALHLQPDCAISADEVPKAKPAPDMLLEACARLRLSPRECVYVGDDRRDIEAGRAAGMPTIAAGWGYEGEHALASWGADYTIHAPQDLLKLLE